MRHTCQKADSVDLQTIGKLKTAALSYLNVDDKICGEQASESYLPPGEGW